MMTMSDAPKFPPERHERPAENSQDCIDGTHAAGNDEPIHEPTDNQLAYMNECGSVQNLPDWMEILVLRIFDEPERTGAQTRAEGC